MERRIARTLALVCAMGLVVAAGAAQARGGGRHCAFRLDPTSRSGRVVHAELVELGCYATYAEALSVGSGGAIRVSSSTEPSSLTQRTLSASTTQTRAGTRGPTLIGTEWVDVAYESSSRSYFAPDTCQGSTYEVSYVGDAWNDDFASGKGFGGCDHNKKYQHSNFGGDVLTCTPKCTNYGSLRNDVSSLRWKP